jgi:hypothetical protein
MRIHAGLPDMFWADAVNTAAYLINRGPSVPLNHLLPEEKWSGKEIGLSHLRVFGCVAYVHIESGARSKLDPKSQKCIFIGYGGDELGYRFWDMQNKKVVRSRNVIFNEEVMYKNRQAAEHKSPVRKDRQFARLEELSNEDVSKENHGEERQQQEAPEVAQPEEQVPSDEPVTPPFVPRVSSRSTKGIPADK